MHPLLEPRSLSPDLARRECDEYLTHRWRRWPWLRRVVGRYTREDLTPLCAWHALTRELLLAPADTGGAREVKDRCEVLLVEALQGQTDRPLATVLAPVMQRYQLTFEDLFDRIVVLERDAHVHAYETRGELLGLAREIAAPEARILLRVAGKENEKNAALADALAMGLQLTQWLAQVRPHFERRHLYLPMDELGKAGADLGALREGRADEGLRRVVLARIDEARRLFRKGWPLCDALGIWHGGLLATVLRWHAATLSAIEHRRGDVAMGPPPAGWLRQGACLGAGMGGRLLWWVD